LLAIITILSFGELKTAAQNSEKNYSWYCVRTNDHSRPSLDTNLSWIIDEKYGAYYIDPNCNNGSAPEDRILYLTFDVGYENGNVAKILDTLKEKDVKGAFFVLSHVIENETELISRMFREGHLVCNHTMHHPDMSKIKDRAAFEKEIVELDTRCLEKTGHHLSRFYRPPEGRFNAQNLMWAKELGYRTVFWSFAYADWDNQKQPDPVASVEKIMANLHNGAIILLHPTSTTNAKILGEVIDLCREQGYHFDTLDNLINSSNTER
jgi:peptidoglycan-N-acetylmuramic acid deacetylase